MVYGSSVRTDIAKVPWDYGKSRKANHIIAAARFASTLAYHGYLTSAILPDGRYVHLFVDYDEATELIDAAVHLSDTLPEA